MYGLNSQLQVKLKRLFTYVYIYTYINLPTKYTLQSWKTDCDGQLEHLKGTSTQLHLYFGPLLGHMSLPSPYLNARTVVDGVKVLGIGPQVAKPLIGHHPALDINWLPKPVFVFFQTPEAPIIGRMQPHCLFSLIPRLPLDHLKGQEFIGHAHLATLKRLQQTNQGPAAAET